MRRRPTALPVTIALSLVLVGCASAGSPAESEPAASSPSSSSSGSVDVENCGFAESFDEVPQAVVTVKSSTTEALIALGVGDAIVGTAYQDGPLPDDMQLETAPPVLDDRMPSAESVLDASPDLVFSGWESAFASDALGTRDELADLGVATYVWPSACESADAPTDVTFDQIADDVTELASIFRVDPSEVLDEQESTLAGLTADDRGLTAMWWSSGSETPYSGAGHGAPQLIMQTAGLANIAADLDGGWAPYNWESVIDADPDVLVLVDADWNTAQHKIEYLEADPVLSQLSAVQSGSYVTVPFAASEAGVRTADAAASVAEQLAAIE